MIVKVLGGFQTNLNLWYEGQKRSKNLQNNLMFARVLDATLISFRLQVRSVTSLSYKIRRISHNQNKIFKDGTDLSAMVFLRVLQIVSVGSLRKEIMIKTKRSR